MQHDWFQLPDSVATPAELASIDGVVGMAGNDTEVSPSWVGRVYGSAAGLDAVAARDGAKRLSETEAVTQLQETPWVTTPDPKTSFRIRKPTHD